MEDARGKKRSANGEIKSQSNEKKDFQDVIKTHRAGGRSVKNVQIPNSDFKTPESGSGGVNDKPGNLRERAKQLLLVRQNLPIWAHQDNVRASLREHDVLLLVGETGSGKSTQLPQFLINEKWCRRKRMRDGTQIGGCIAITQPRRVAAISLARRVAEEMGSTLGNASPRSEVGYSVRFDRSEGPCVRIKFLTEGMLLQEMLRDPELKEYSCVVVDEVHERGVDVDLCLAFLKKLVRESKVEGDKGTRGGLGMKMVVMSATADMERIKEFLEDECESEKHQNGNERAPKSNKENEVEEEFQGFSDDDNDSATMTVSRTSEGVIKGDDLVASLFIKGRQYHVQVHYSPQPVADIIDAALQRVIDIHTREPLPGDVLVFLTGQETVESLLSLIEQYSTTVQKDKKLASSLPKLLVLPLYAALPSNMQQRVFQATPNFTRKIILATNIAETSITVSGVRHVIDCGKSKRRIFRPSLNLDSLLTAPISRSSANQRAGRAGRDAPGHAYRLYTETDFHKLAQDTEPEILRCDLSQLVITLKSHGIKSLDDFSMLTKPPSKALQRALMRLLQLQAIDGTRGDITPLGKDMSLLPLPTHFARILLASAETKHNCLDAVIDILSALSVENVFMNIHSQSQHGRADLEENDDNNSQDPRLKLRQQFFRREGDHLTLLATVQAYVDENTDRKRWCEERGISHRAMQGVLDVRKQLSGLMKKKRQNQLENASGNGDVEDAADANTRILKCLLTGLWTNVARLSTGNVQNGANATGSRGPPAQYTTLSTNQTVSIHPSSVLFGRRVEAIMGSEYVYTTKAYARCVSSVQLGWLVEDMGAADGSMT